MDYWRKLTLEAKLINMSDIQQSKKKYLLTEAEFCKFKLLLES